jgi:hypothetical protein
MNYRQTPRKIDSAELPANTQAFLEQYAVTFPHVLSQRLARLASLDEEESAALQPVVDKVARLFDAAVERGWNYADPEQAQADADWPPVTFGDLHTRFLASAEWLNRQMEQEKTPHSSDFAELYDRLCARLEVQIEQKINRETRRR